MNRERVKVYTYKRVSTTMQIDGYSLDAQKSRIKAFADYNDYEIVREYEDAGKSGKSIEGRIQFNQMMDDIKSGKDGVSFVLVFKLSRFGRNAADVLSTLQVMQDFGVNLICVEDGIDSSKDAGKLMISVLSAVAEIERENIRVQTMEGRIQKAREGKWNGGFAPYGYQLVDGELQINEEEAAAIRVIFDQYVNTDIGSNGIAKYLENHGIRKIQRQNGKNPLFDAHLIRLILKNPVYCGKIAYGRRKTEKIHGTRNDYHLVEQDNYLLVDGLHEAIVSEEVWQAAQVKLLAQAKKYEHVNKGKDTRTHLLSGIVKCPICGAGMYGNKCIKHKKDGTKYKDFYYYGCKHRTMTRGHKCDYRKQIREELLDDAVAEVIVALVSKPKFASMMQEKINMKVDTSVLDQEIANHEKQLRQYYSTKSKLMEEIDSLDPDDRHYFKRKADLDDRLYRMYDKIEDEESQMIEARAKRQAIEAEKLTGDNIYKVLIYFDKLYSAMNDVERRRVMETLISEIQIHEDRKPNGQWLKSIRFRLPIIEEDMSLSLDNDEHVESRAVLATYLYPHLKGRMTRWLEQHIGNLSLSKHEMDAVRQAQRLYHSGQFGIEEIAEKMDVLLEQAVKHIRYNTHFVGVNDLIPGSYDGDPFERLMPGNLSVSAEQVVYRKVCIELLQELFDALPKKDRDILGKFYGVFGFEKTSLKEIGMYHMMKESAVEKAKERAVTKLKKAYPGSRLQIWRNVHRMIRRPILPAKDDRALRRSFTTSTLRNQESGRS